MFHNATVSQTTEMTHAHNLTYMKEYHMNKQHFVKDCVVSDPLSLIGL